MRLSERGQDRTAAGGGTTSGWRRDDDAPGPPSLLILESCHSTWLFEPEHRRFRRVLKGLDLDATHGSTNWRDYHSLELDESDGFVVLLNERGTRLIRSWRHTEHCSHCDGDVTGELSADDLRVLVRA